MNVAYSANFVALAVQLLADGISLNTVAKKLNVKACTLKRWYIKKYGPDGRFKPSEPRHRSQYRTLITIKRIVLFKTLHCQTMSLIHLIRREGISKATAYHYMRQVLKFIPEQTNHLSRPRRKAGLDTYLINQITPLPFQVV